jgi:SAM-dependent methyltransferase
MRMFGRPQGLAGGIAGLVLARSNRKFAEEIVAFLEVQPSEQVLEIGFGPGVAIELLTRAAPGVRVAGIDVSKEMVEQASARNAAAIRTGAVGLRHGTVERMPFEDGAFDLAVPINSMQVWPDVDAELREIRRVLRAGGRIALAFTPRSGQPRAGVTARLVSGRLPGRPPGGVARRLLRPGPQAPLMRLPAGSAAAAAVQAVPPGDQTAPVMVRRRGACPTQVRRKGD